MKKKHSKMGMEEVKPMAGMKGKMPMPTVKLARGVKPKKSKKGY